MSPAFRLVTAAMLSLLWAAAFLAGVQRGSLYPILGTVAAIVVVVVMVVGRGSGGVGAALRSRHIGRDAGLGLGIGLVTVALTHLGFFLVGPVLPGLFADVERLQGVAAVTPARLGVVLLIAVAEELLWRGLTLDAMRQQGVPAPAAIAGAACVYGVSQVGPLSPWLVATAVGFGVLWGGLRVASGGLWMPVLAHVTWTVAILGVVPLR